MGCVERDRLVLFCFLPAQCAELAPKKKARVLGSLRREAQGAGTAQNQEGP